MACCCLVMDMWLHCHGHFAVSSWTFCWVVRHCTIRKFCMFSKVDWAMSMLWKLLETSCTADCVCLYGQLHDVCTDITEQSRCIHLRFSSLCTSCILTTVSPASELYRRDTAGVQENCACVCQPKRLIACATRGNPNEPVSMQCKPACCRTESLLNLA